MTSLMNMPGPPATARTQLTLRVHRRRRLADRIIALDLRGDADEALPEWEPGAHVDLRLANGLTRQYSLCGAPSDRTTYTVAVLREDAPRGRGGSAFIHDSVDAGDLVGVTGPRNHFRLEPARAHRFVAGGIGITPILPMVRACVAAGSPWSLHYGGRTRVSMAFVEELEALGDAVRVHPEDVVGMLDLERVLDGLADGELIYVCGPGPLIAAVTDAAGRAGRAEAVRFELFHAEGAPPVAAAPDRPETFDVVLARSGITLTVGPGETVLEHMVAAGVSVFTDCEEGLCGSCECKVLEGEVDHRDHVLTGEERNRSTSMMVCVSRAKGSRLVLDA